MIKHSFNCGIADDPTAAAGGQVLPSHWNADHTLTGQIPAANGGTGQDSSAWSGLVKTASGTWSAATAGVDYQAALTTSSSLALSTVQVSALKVASVSGLLKGTAGVVGAAVAGTDYQTPLVAGVDYQSPLTTSSAVALGTAQVSSLSVASLSGMLKASAGVVSAAAAGTDYQGVLTTSSNLALSTVQVSALSVSNLTGALTASSGAVSAVAPGTSGNVLTSNGSAWVSSAPTGGSTTLTINNKTANYTVVAGDNGTVINCTSGTFTVTLTAAGTLGAGFNVIVENTSSTLTQYVTIAPSGTDNIDGNNSSVILRAGQSIRLLCDGVGFTTISSGFPRTMIAVQPVTTSVGATASGAGSVGIGPGAVASASYAISIGRNTQAGANYNTSIGLNSGATGSQTATGAGAMALGGSYASGADSFAAAIANNTSTYGAQANNSIAMGYQAKSSTNTSATAIGNSTVATGIGSLAIGNGASASGQGSAALGGQNASAGPNYSTAIGASSAGSGAATVTGLGSVAIGGSYASGTDSFAAAIANNTSSYGAQGANGIAMGKTALASGANTVAISTGTTGTAYALGSGSIVIGAQCYTPGSSAMACGYMAVANVYGKYSYASGASGAQGDSQTSVMVLRVSTTDATATKLTSDAGAAGGSNQLILANNQAIAFRCQVIGRRSVSQTDECRAWEFSGVIRRGANAASTTLVAAITPTLIAGDAGTVTWGGVAVSADTTNGGLAITVTGEAAKNIRWVATVNSTEVIYA